ncbi:MAG: PQQ-binding-like beta-propeller repeat protein [Candidatus Brocadiia bacterium]
MMRTSLRSMLLAALAAGLAGVPAPRPAWAGARAEARRILDAAGVRGGLVVHLGCGDGTLTAALRATPRYLVHGLDADEEEVARARKHIRGRGLYGPVAVEHWTAPVLPYADDLVSLLVVEEPGDVPREEMTRVLAPRGVLYARQEGGWTQTVKPWPDDIDEWTHYLHGPDNNAVARDTRVGPPRHLRWKSDPMWCRSHDGVGSSVAVVLSAGGRLFSLIDEGLIGQPGLPSRWTLVARDGFNGKLLWKKRMPGRPGQKALVAHGERVYAAFGRRDPIQVLDAATGESLATWKGTEGSDELVCTGDLVVAHLAGRPRSKDRKDDTIAALDPETGQARWETPSKPIVRGTLAAADGRVFYHNRQEVVCLDLETGKAQWRTPSDGGRRGGTLAVYQGAVLFHGGPLRAFAADTGKPLWKGPGVNRRLGCFGASGLVWVTHIHGHGRSFLWTPAPVVSTGYHPRTGEAERTVEVSHLVSPGHHIRCYPAKATERYILLPKRGVEFVDLRGDNHMRHDWLRAPCGHGVMAANGLLYMPPHQCFCYPGVKLAGFNALAAEQAEVGRGDGRLERGPAWPTEPAEQPASEADWPLYRHDARRSGRAGCELPVQLGLLWQRELGGTLSQPVAAEGRLVVAEQDACTVRCLDAASGEPRWEYVAGGRVDSSPTLYRGLVLFGSTDGYLYCLRASDGALAWRFRAAPGRRRIVAFDRLESSWPAHGSVVVQDGLVYCTAGRSSYLDGGIWAYALEPGTGKVVHTAHLESPRPDATREAGRPFDMEGARSDLLVSDGTDLYMFFVRLAPDLSLKDTPRITKLGDREVGAHLMSNAGFLDKTWFDRTYWIHGRRWPGYYFAYNAAKTGRILVFDEEKTYGLHVFTTRQGHSPRFWPGREGYELFADLNAQPHVLRGPDLGREKGNGYSRALPPLWSVRIPVRVQGLVLAGPRLYLAGPPDVVPKDEPYAALEGREGARLWVVSAEDGSRLAEQRLDRPLVFDGMSAARGRLYLATDDGRLLCMGAGGQARSTLQEETSR